MAFKPKDFTVWMEIPVSDMDRAVTYYNTVCDADLTIDNSGPNPMAMFKPADEKTGVAGHLYPGKPAPRRLRPDDPPRRARKAGRCAQTRRDSRRQSGLRADHHSGGPFRLHS